MKKLIGFSDIDKVWVVGGGNDDHFVFGHQVLIDLGNEVFFEFLALTGKLFLFLQILLSEIVLCLSKVNHTGLHFFCHQENFVHYFLNALLVLELVGHVERRNIK